MNFFAGLFSYDSNGIWNIHLFLQDINASEVTHNPKIKSGKKVVFRRRCVPDLTAGGRVYPLRRSLYFFY